MARFIRFIVHQRIEDHTRPVGVFTAAYYLLREGDLPRRRHERLSELLRWFEAELPVPPRGSIPERAIFWFGDAGPFSKRIWEIVNILNDHSIDTELITERTFGRIVYQDRYQIAAFPLKRQRR